LTPFGQGAVAEQGWPRTSNETGACPRSGATPASLLLTPPASALTAALWPQAFASANAVANSAHELAPCIRFVGMGMEWTRRITYEESITSFLDSRAAYVAIVARRRVADDFDWRRGRLAELCGAS
jgi:hypothetical protein